MRITQSGKTPEKASGGGDKLTKEEEEEYGEAAKRYIVVN